MDQSLKQIPIGIEKGKKSRYRLLEKSTVLIDKMNEALIWSRLKIQTNTEYLLERLSTILEIDRNTFIYGKEPVNPYNSSITKSCRSILKNWKNT